MQVYCSARASEPKRAMVETQRRNGIRAATVSILRTMSDHARTLTANDLSLTNGMRAMAQSAR